ncbi:MAG: endonuclease III [Candidatus Schekmanbacteria bacterium]|nr:MAG: endonuclease III [Candidatus Schekmanbacteria bacterium]
MADNKEKKRVEKIIEILDKTYPQAKCALNHKNPYQLLVATILSAQCTDKRVNMVTKDLFKKYPTIKDIAEANQKEFEEDIRTTGFFRNKAKNIIAASKMIIEKFNGKVPKTMDELLTLPGVARKTANIVLNSGYGITVGIAVDTHVKRLSQRLGLTKETNPDKIEKDLMNIIPKEKWGDLNHQLIEHGRQICFARNPKCENCTLSTVCPSAGKC